MDTLTVSNTEKLKIERRFAESIEKSKGFKDISELLIEVDAYRRGLRSIGISDWQLREMNVNFFKNTIAFLKSGIIATTTLTLGLPGLVFLWPLKNIIETLAEAKRQQALAVSSVKIKANDVVGSWKI